MSHIKLYISLDCTTLCACPKAFRVRGIEPGICLLKVLSKALTRLKVLSQYLGVEVSSQRSVSRSVRSSSRSRARGKSKSSWEAGVLTVCAGVVIIAEDSSEARIQDNPGGLDTISTLPVKQVMSPTQ
jgi:hypothetical protein